MMTDALGLLLHMSKCWSVISINNPVSYEFLITYLHGATVGNAYSGWPNDKNIFKTYVTHLMNKMPFSELKNNRGQFKIVINHNGHQGCSSITDKFWKCNKQGSVCRKERWWHLHVYAQKIWLP